ncbi:MAG TPA: NAD-glutamate dehydrogenase, partial [Bauldia sp.]|nr:NAD-glutamate dehydrogenase [Bauldia sp.]
MGTEKTERNRLIGLARRALGRGEGDHARLRALAGDLFARVSLEDLAVYDAADLAAFVRDADALLAERPKGGTVIRLSEPAGETPGSPAAEVTVIGILNQDMPFLLDSTLGELQAFGAGLRLVAHPIVNVTRDGEGRLVAYHGTGHAPAGAVRESLIQIHVGRIDGAERRRMLVERLESLFVEVRRAVADWPAMLARLKDVIAGYRANPPPIPEAEAKEAIAFLEWLADGDFTFLGVRDYDYSGGARRGQLKRADVPGLGILADPAVHVLRRGAEGVTTTPAIREFLMRPEPLIVTKSNLVSRVHRRAYADYIGVKRYGAKGALAGEVRFLGLFTSTAYTRSVRAIPYLRRKAARIMERAGFDPASHSGKSLWNVLETYPRDELFQIDEDTLFDFAMQIMALDERPRVRVLARRDRYDRFVSVIVFVPRDRYDSDVRVKIGAYLAEVFDAHVSAFHPAFPEGALTRVHFILGRRGGETPNPDQALLEAMVEEIVTDWEDDLATAIRRAYPADVADPLVSVWRGAFPAGYRETTAPDAAVADIRIIDALTEARPVAGIFRRNEGDPGHCVLLKLIHLGGPVPLSDRVPMLEDMGLRVIDEQTYEVRPAGRAAAFLHDMALERADGGSFDLDAVAPLALAAFMAVWYGEAESDGYNALTVNAGLPWRDVALLRAVSRYLRQTGTPLTQHYMWTTLGRHPALARALVELFRFRFDPDAADEDKAKRKIAEIESGLESVDSLDEDRIIRRFLNIVESIVRTNVFQVAPDGKPRAEIVFKLDPKRVDELPSPRPFREIFVYSPRVEGVHLRFGPVARGGIRWSDRPLDFRTEVLGLAKAQQAKNAVIVPVGAKGGFVPKRLPPASDRAAVAEEGKAAYEIYISRLLDITDNLDGNRIIPPERVVRRDGDDPYLVVAADKGTATFSDTANAVAEAHRFWLGDAFASGGSHGYDHKKMGITARGAWVAVKRHFREMDIDIETTPFTVVGVGDMSGDVFGNAMLLSPATKLIAAFDHRDIFIDPDPDPASSFAERRRLFELLRSSWQDYDRRLISPGGGVFSRRDKAIPLSPEMRALLDLSGERATPNEVLRSILKARADLLFFGGIGTFVRAASESDERVGDRTNDAVRVTAEELRVRVVGEGANLGMTQLARVAYCLNGGRCNSDAIDNSAGVNTSDVEVNIKIALGRAVRDGRLDMKRRDRLLKAMTDEVAGLVLRNNYRQTLAISLSQSRGFEYFGFKRRLMQELERRGLLDRKVESLPDDAALQERHEAGLPLTRPELGVLMAFAKIALKVDLLHGEVARDDALEDELMGYFPSRMRKAHATDIAAHPLRAEIIATTVANAMIDRGGPTYVLRMADRTGASPVAIARAYVVARDAFALQALNAEIDALDNRVPGMEQLGLYRMVQDLLVSRTVWFLRNAVLDDGIRPVITAYA